MFMMVINLEGVEILSVHEWPRVDGEGRFVNWKTITYKVADSEHTLDMLSSEYTAKKAQAAVDKAAKEILDLIKPVKE